MSVNDWTLTRAEIINLALRLIGVLPTGEDTSSDFITNQTDEAQNALNMILSGIQNETTQPFRRKQFSAPLVASEEVTGSDSSVYTSRKTHTSPNAATWVLSTAYSKGDLVFPSSRGGYYYQAQGAGTSDSSEPTFPVQPGSTVVDNDITWKAFPDSKPVTGASYKEFWELTGSTGSVYAQNTQYRTISDVQLDPNVLSVNKVWYREDSDRDVKLELISRDTYLNISDKIETGEPIYAYFDDTFVPKLKLWPKPDTTNYLIMYDAVTVFNDMDLGADTGASTENFLKRWIRFLSYELAVHLGEEYQIKESKILRLERKADKYKKFAIMKDGESVERRFTKGAY
tara:strand:- start:5863 stop:6891 length:1029 start_codon:yes stop_codon:yes gene_type:complete